MNIEGRKEKTQKEIKKEKDILENVIGKVMGKETQIEMSISRTEEEIIEELEQQIILQEIKEMVLKKVKTGELKEMLALIEESFSKVRKEIIKRWNQS